MKNVGIPQHDNDVDIDSDPESEEGDEATETHQKLENRYLDSSNLAKGNGKNHWSLKTRIYKLTITDGINVFQAIE